MHGVTIQEIDERLKRLPPEELAVVYDLVCILAARRDGEIGEDSIGTMIASEPVLSRDWGRPEEDEAWAHL